MKHMFTLAAGAALTFALGCGGNSALPTTPGESTNLNAIVSIRVDGLPATVTVGERHQLRVTATLAGGATLDVTAKAVFKTSNAAILSISAGGEVTALAPGDCGLTALVENISANVTAHVKAKDVITKLELRGKTDLLLGEQTQLQVIATLDTGAQVDVTGKATLSSSNDAVLKVSASGHLEAVGTGACDLLSVVDGITATVKASVRRGDIVRLDLRVRADLFVGDTTDVKVLATLSGGAQIDVTAHANLSSTNSSILKVNANALIEAAGPGSCDLIALAEGVRATLRLNVAQKGASIIKLRIEGALTLKVGQTSQLKAIATLSDNTEADVTASVSWATSNGSCCLVNVLGLLTALIPGDCLITGTLDGIKVSAPVKVTLL